ncbi:MAG: hypothetical protein GXN99_02905 [Candidatus Nanohaloarchaeota archaeon]|nr:hypothetical protein [Candidatus Nanohaloarchaeota archaeon]
MSMVFFLSNYAYAIGVGTIPGVLDLGEVKRGQTVVGEFYITSTITQPMILILNYIPPHYSIFQKEKTRAKDGYEFKPGEASEEDISSWVKIVPSTVLISPDDKKIIRLPDGGSVAYNQKFSVKIKIPDEAEPGYHVGSVNIAIKPKKTTGEGASISTLGITRPVFVFRVSGNAFRDGKIIGVEAKRLSDNMVRVDVLFKNTGTVTYTASFDKLEVYDDFGYKTGNIAVRMNNKVKPGEIIVLSAYWRDSKGIKSGSYNVEAEVSYITGKAKFSGPLEVLDEIYVPKEGNVLKEEGGINIPWWYLLIILGLIALYIYWKM